jgi:hypothetical protein
VTVQRITCNGAVTGGCNRVGIDYRRYEAFVLGLVWEVLDSPRFAVALAAEQREDATQVALYEDLREIERKLTRAYDMYVDGDVTKPRYLKKKGELEKDAADIRRKIEGLKSDLTLSSVGDVATARRLWKERDVAWQRQFVSAVIERIEIAPWPQGVGTSAKQRKGETDEAYAERTAARWEGIMMERVSIDWRI